MDKDAKKSIMYAIVALYLNLEFNASVILNHAVQGASFQ
jgi:hypothetical protein